MLLNFSLPFLLKSSLAFTGALQETAGNNRIGVSYSLRENNIKDIVKLIKSVASVKKLQLA